MSIASYYDPFRKQNPTQASYYNPEAPSAPYNPPSPNVVSPSYYDPGLHDRTYYKGEVGWVPPLNDPFKQVANAEIRLASMGHEIPKSGNWWQRTLGTALDVLNWVDSKTRGPIAAAINTGIQGGNAKQIFQSAGRVLRGKEQAPSGQDILDNLGMKEGWGRTALGFGLDVLLDPLTYVSFGSGSLAKSASKEAAEGVAKGLGKKAAKEAGEAFLNEATEMAIRRGVMEAGERLGKNVAYDAFRAASAAWGDDALHAAARSAQGRVNQSLASMFGKGAQKVVRAAGDDLATTLMGLADDIAYSARNAVGKDQAKVLGDVISGMVGRGVLASDDVARATAAFSKLNSNQLAAVDAISRFFGSSIEIEKLASAGKSLGRISGKGAVSGVGKIANLVSRGVEAEKLAVGAVKQAAKDVQTAHKLIALVDDAGRFTLKIGLPFGPKKELIDFTALARKAGLPTIRGIKASLWQKSALIRNLDYWWGRAFNEKYISKVFDPNYNPAADPQAWTQLKVGREVISEAGRAAKNIPGMVAREVVQGINTTGIADDVLDAAIAAVKNHSDEAIRRQFGTLTTDAISAATAFGPELASNKKVMEAVPFYMERLITNDGGFAARKWAQVAASLSPQELQMVEKAAAKWTLASEVIGNLELKMLFGTTDLDKIAKLDSVFAQGYLKNKGQYIMHLYKNAGPTIPGGHLAPQAARLGRQFSTRHSSQLARQFNSLAQAMEAGLDPVTDASQLFATRLALTRRMVLADHLFKSLKDLPAVFTTKPTGGVVNLIDGLQDVGLFKQMGQGGVFDYAGRLVSGLQGYYAHPEVIQFIKQMDYVFTTDEGMSMALKWWQGVNNALKSVQLSSPSFLARNFTGEAYMAFMGGVQPGSVGEAIKIMRGTAGDTVTIRGRVLDVAKEMDFYNRSGDHLLTHVRGSMVEGLPEAIASEIQIAKHGERVIRFGEKLSEVRGVKDAAKWAWSKWDAPIKSLSDFQDKMWRLAHYLDLRGRGFSQKDALMQMRKFHVDYGSLTAFERNVMRNIVPYYTFTRKNIPNMLRLMFEQPAAFTSIGHLVNNASDALGNPETSEYLEEGLAIPLWENADGTVQYLNWNLPIVDLFRFLNPVEEALQMISPLISTGPALLFNVNPLGGRPIRKYEGDTASNLKFLARQLGSPGRFIADGRLIDDALGLNTADDEIRQQRPDQIPLFGSFLPIQNPMQVATNKAYGRRDQLQDYIRYLQERGHFVPSLQQVYDGIPGLFRGLNQPSYYNPFGSPSPSRSYYNPFGGGL